ncbi:MAG: hypothetical protein ACLRT4_04700 [Thomasclavelia sp.]
MANRTDPSILQIIDGEVSLLIAKSRNISKLDALRIFLNSKTHNMLLNDDLKLWYFSNLAIFDMWENEEATGDPINSLYLRGD